MGPDYWLKFLIKILVLKVRVQKVISWKENFQFFSFCNFCINLFLQIITFFFITLFTTRFIDVNEKGALI